MMRAWAALAVLCSSRLIAGDREISERMDKPPEFTLRSSRAPIDLEFCIADALADRGVVSAFHDGASRTVLTAASPSAIATQIMIVVDVRADATGTTMAVYRRGKLSLSNLQDRLRTCA